MNIKGVTKKTGQTLFVILHRLIQFQKRALYHQKGNIHSFQNWYYNFIYLKGQRNGMRKYKKIFFKNYKFCKKKIVADFYPYIFVKFKKIILKIYSYGWLIYFKILLGFRICWVYQDLITTEGSIAILKKLGKLLNFIFGNFYDLCWISPKCF